MSRILHISILVCLFWKPVSDCQSSVSSTSYLFASVLLSLHHQIQWKSQRFSKNDTLTVVPQLESLAKTGCATIHCICISPYARNRNIINQGRFMAVFILLCSSVKVVDMAELMFTQNSIVLDKRLCVKSFERF